MVEIISKSDGPRREDAAAKHFIRENAGTINKIAQQLSGGRLRSLSNAETIPAPLPTKRGPSAPSRDGEKKPYVKVSHNGRVIAVDFQHRSAVASHRRDPGSGRQPPVPARHAREPLFHALG